MTKGHDGDAAPIPPGFGMGPAMEMPLGVIDTEALGPTLIVMQNLPSVASLASSLVGFIVDRDLVDDLLAWMFQKMCEKHRTELPADRVGEILAQYKLVLDSYLESLGMSEDDCEGNHG